MAMHITQFDMIIGCLLLSRTPS